MSTVHFIALLWQRGQLTRARGLFTVANAETLFAATEGADANRPPSIRQPVYSIAWSGFAEEGFLDRWSSSVKYATGAQSGPMIPKVDEDAEADVPGASVLTVLGGLLPEDAIGIHCLVFKVNVFVDIATHAS